MQDDSKIVVGKANHQSHLYTFFDFVAKTCPTLLLTHANDERKIWHERHAHLNFRYMQQLIK